jgi:hypothetical protein
MVKIEFGSKSVRARESIGVTVRDMPTDSIKSVTLNFYEISKDGSRKPYNAEVAGDKTIKCAKECGAMDFGVYIPRFTKNKVVIEASVEKDGTILKAEENLPLRE